MRTRTFIKVKYTGKVVGKNNIRNKIQFQRRSMCFWKLKSMYNCHHNKSVFIILIKMSVLVYHFYKWRGSYTLSTSVLNGSLFYLEILLTRTYPLQFSTVILIAHLRAKYHQCFQIKWSTFHVPSRLQPFKTWKYLVVRIIRLIQSSS